MSDEDKIKINLDYLDILLNKSSEQYDLFYDSALNTGAATISQAASPNTWPYPYVITNSSNVSPGLTFSDNWTIPEQALHVKGNANFEGDVKLKGKSLSETLEKIEERLAILHPNEKLEDKWLELKKLGEMYRALEKDIIEKEKIWDTLKK